MWIGESFHNFLTCFLYVKHFILCGFFASMEMTHFLTLDIFLFRINWQSMTWITAVSSSNDDRQTVLIVAFTWKVLWLFRVRRSFEQITLHIFLITENLIKQSNRVDNHRCYLKILLSLCIFCNVPKRCEKIIEIHSKLSKLQCCWGAISSNTINIEQRMLAVPSAWAP